MDHTDWRRQDPSRVLVRFITGVTVLSTDTETSSVVGTTKCVY